MTSLPQATGEERRQMWTWATRDRHFPTKISLIVPEYNCNPCTIHTVNVILVDRPCSLEFSWNYKFKYTKLIFVRTCAFETLRALSLHLENCSQPLALMTPKISPWSNKKIQKVCSIKRNFFLHPPVCTNAVSWLFVMEQHALTYYRTFHVSWGFQLLFFGWY